MSINVFFSYSHHDINMRRLLDVHLGQLKNQHAIKTWHDGQITPGQEWERTIWQRFEEAHVILLLVSAPFLDSSFCYEKELTRAIERHNEGHARVIPIILRPCDWQSAPFAKLQALPSNAKPVVRWSTQDAGFADVARGIRKALEEVSFGSPQVGPRPSANDKGPIEGASNYVDSTWLDGSVHALVAEGITIRYAGFKVNMAQLDNPANIDKLLVDQLLALIRKIRRL